MFKRGYSSEVRDSHCQSSALNTAGNIWQWQSCCCNQLSWFSDNSLCHMTRLLHGVDWKRVMVDIDFYQIQSIFTPSVKFFWHKRKRSITNSSPSNCTWPVTDVAGKVLQLIFGRVLCTININASLNNGKVKYLSNACNIVEIYTLIKAVTIILCIIFMHWCDKQ